MCRPDTGTRKNMIMVMAASIIADKIDYTECIIEQYEANGKNLTHADTYNILKGRLVQMKDTLTLLDDNAGCW